MARQIDRLSARGVNAKRKPGYYPDGAGLYLQVSKSGTKSWVFRFMLAGVAREMGLGHVSLVSLEEARRLRDQQRKLRGAGVDPIEARKAERTRAALDLARSKTFQECAETYIEAHRAGWKNAKHAAQWGNTLATYAYPRIGKLPVQVIETGHINEVLQPIWNSKRETAVRLRGRIEKVLDWAAALGYRQGLNPARWRGHLDGVLSKDKRHARTHHHAAIAFPDIQAFLVALRAQEGSAAKALEFLILTAARTGEVIGMAWPEVDVSGAVWTVPAERMKNGKEHRVPLSPAAVKCLKALPGREGPVFPGGRANKPLSNMAMLELLRRMNRGGITVHGFRSTFRDWAAECTSYPREVCEMALAHTIGDKVEAAYRRGDLFEKRRLLMLDWARYCESPTRTETVTPIRRATIPAAA